MKSAKRFIALFVVAVMLVSTCVFAGAATTTSTVTLNKNTSTAKTLSNSATYSTYSISGSDSGKTATSYVLEFNPANGAIPMAYAAYGGANLPYFSTHINRAKDAGYEVIGAINGSFFNGSNMCGINISGGRIIAADAACAGESVGIFSSDGKFTQALTNLSYTVEIKGEKFANGLASVNKKYSYVTGRNADFVNRFFYYDAYGKSGVSGSVEGYEILCEKLDYSELAVGHTLKGRVISVTETTYGANRPTEHQYFTLFMPKASSKVSYATGLTAGDVVSISVTEQNSAAKEAMNNAYSAISSCYALVKDGVDQTNTQSNIGTHSVSLSRAWTAFGVKADGSFVYFISEEYGLTLKDVAAAMMKLGCIHVYRLDGGGSSAMYNETDGVVYLAETTNSEYGRAVCDVLLVVSKESTYDESLASELKNVVATAKTVEKPNAQLEANIAKAEALLKETYPSSGDVKKLLSSLSLNSVLTDLVSQAVAEDSGHYRASNYAILKTAIDNAKKVLDNSSATQTQYANSISELSDALSLSEFSIVSIGASYTASDSDYTYQSGSSLFDDEIRLTDGFKSTYDPFSSTYSAFNKNVGGIDHVEVLVDLGTKVQTNTFSIYSASKQWGVNPPYYLKVFGSNDGTNFTEIGYTDKLVKVGEGLPIDGVITDLSKMTVVTESIQNYRYIRFDSYSNGAFLWLDEVEIALNGTLLPEGDTPIVSDGKGDINNDGKMTATDYLMLKKVVMNILSVGSLKDPDNAFARCDINGDGKLTAIDYFMLKKSIFA